MALFDKTGRAIPVPKLPDYPRQDTSTATRLRARAEAYRTAAERLRQELAATTDVMVDALQRDDARAAAERRLAGIGTNTSAYADSYAAARRGRS